MTQNKITENISYLFRGADCTKKIFLEIVCPSSYVRDQVMPTISELCGSVIEPAGHLVHEEGIWSAQLERKLRYFPTRSPNLMLQKAQPPTHTWQILGMVHMCCWQPRTFTSHQNNTLCQYPLLKYITFLLHLFSPQNKLAGKWS